ncbi:uncharacterized protein LOC135143166 [Zophobas morio]|uniref:uncharacterized protein LOC135143166 n=1 Tax=Zophobas morio TaxID=2755281 RepID=UPI003083288B
MVPRRHRQTLRQHCFTNPVTNQPPRRARTALLVLARRSRHESSAAREIQCCTRTSSTENHTIPRDGGERIYQTRNHCPARRIAAVHPQHRNRAGIAATRSSPTGGGSNFD